MISTNLLIQPNRSDMSDMECVAVCCSALQCVALRCSVLQCVAVRDTSDMDYEYRSNDKSHEHPVNQNSVLGIYD